jgi:hypothetical protein
MSSRQILLDTAIGPWTAQIAGLGVAELIWLATIGAQVLIGSAETFEPVTQWRLGDVPGPSMADPQPCHWALALLADGLENGTAHIRTAQTVQVARRRSGLDTATHFGVIWQQGGIALAMAGVIATTSASGSRQPAELSEVVTVGWALEERPVAMAHMLTHAVRHAPAPAATPGWALARHALVRRLRRAARPSEDPQLASLIAGMRPERLLGT